MSFSILISITVAMNDADDDCDRLSRRISLTPIRHPQHLLRARPERCLRCNLDLRTQRQAAVAVRLEFGPDLDTAAVAVVTLDVEAPVAAETLVEPYHQILDGGRAGGRYGQRCRRRRTGAVRPGRSAFSRAGSCRAIRGACRQGRPRCTPHVVTKA